MQKLYRFIEFNKNAWWKSYIDMNTDLRKKNQKMIVWKIFFKLMNNEDLEKSMENVRKHRDIKFVAT